MYTTSTYRYTEDGYPEATLTNNTPEFDSIEAAREVYLCGGNTARRVIFDTREVVVEELVPGMGTPAAFSMRPDNFKKETAVSTAEESWSVPRPMVVIAMERWVFAGMTHMEGDWLVIEDAFTVREWGTTQGIGELRNGTTSDTKLDYNGRQDVHKMMVVATVHLTDAGWRSFKEQVPR